MVKKIMFFMFVATIVAIGGCQKEEEFLNEAEDLNSSEYEFASNRLTSIGFNLLRDSKDTHFREEIYRKVSAKFDQDFEVLLENLEIPSSHSNLKSANNTNLLEEFKGIDGNNYYPQIFIPFYDELKEKEKLGITKPVLVVSAGGEDDKKSEFEGYVLNNENQIEKSDYLITEDFARNNEVWVISINERVDNNGEVLIEYSSSNSDPLKSATSSTINCRIDDMIVKRHFESWVNGKSEVSIRAYREYWDGLNSSGQAVDEICDRTTSNFTGILIRQYSRDDVKYKRTFTLNYNLEADWDVTDFYTQAITYLYIIYESDSWPTGTKTESTTLSDGTARSMTFRSADGSYSIGTIYGNTNNGEFQSKYAGSYSINNSNIQFNTEIY